MEFPRVVTEVEEGCDVVDSDELACPRMGVGPTDRGSPVATAVARYRIFNIFFRINS
jgi:hypothetical protein